MEHPVPGQQVRIVGRVDAASVAEVRLALHEAVDHGIGELLVEVRGLELGDATGLGALLGAHRRATRRGRTVVLIGVPATMARLLAYTRLTRVLRSREDSARSA
ncbi:MAG TPA: STAS domain-containing protein [Mycobacteriales bacterium]|nr:STAS domain-containing protein [Mycobacteriales bacterium]